MKFLTSTFIVYCALASGAWAAPAEAATDNVVNVADAGVALSPAGDFVGFTTAACGANTCHGTGGSSACNSGCQSCGYARGGCCGILWQTCCCYT